MAHQDRIKELKEGQVIGPFGGPMIYNPKTGISYDANRPEIIHSACFEPFDKWYHRIKEQYGEGGE